MGLGSIGMTELLVIGGIIMLIFGPSQLPKLGRGLGQTIKEFRGIGRELQDARAEVEEEVKDVKRALK